MARGQSQEAHGGGETVEGWTSSSSAPGWPVGWVRNWCPVSSGCCEEEGQPLLGLQSQGTNPNELGDPWSKT